MIATTFRRYVRYDYLAPVRMKECGESQVIEARAYNLSQGGMFAGVQCYLPVGAEVTCALNMEGTTTTLRGRVAWTGEQSNRRGEVGKGIGIAFERPLPIDEIRLQELTSRTWSSPKIERRLPPSGGELVAAPGQRDAARAAVDEPSPSLPDRSGTRLRREVNDRDPTLPYIRPTWTNIGEASNYQIPKDFDLTAIASSSMAKPSAPTSGAVESVSSWTENTERFSIPWWNRIYFRLARATQGQGRWWLIAALGLVGAIAALLSGALSFRPDLIRGAGSYLAMVREAPSFPASVGADPLPPAQPSMTPRPALPFAGVGDPELGEGDVRPPLENTGAEPVRRFGEAQGSGTSAATEQADPTGEPIQTAENDETGPANPYREGHQPAAAPENEPTANPYRGEPRVQAAAVEGSEALGVHQLADGQDPLIPESAEQPAEPGSDPESETMVEPSESPSDEPAEEASEEPFSGPRVRALGARIDVDIPVRGSLAGLDSYRLTRPSGVSIDLPRQPLKIRYGMYRIDRLGIRRIWIRKYKHGAQVRVVTDKPFGSYSVTTRTEAIRVTFRP